MTTPRSQEQRQRRCLSRLVQLFRSEDDGERAIKEGLAIIALGLFAIFLLPFGLMCIYAIASMIR